MDDIPTFTLGEGDEDEQPDEKQRPRYLVHIEKGVDLRQIQDSETVSKLTADVLDIVRAFDQPDRQQEPDNGDKPQGVQQGQKTSSQSLILTWEGRLTLEACANNDDRCGPDLATVVTATGRPAKLESAEANAECSSLRFLPESNQVDLYGSLASPALVQSADQGTISGLHVATRRVGDELFIDLAGPGTLTLPGEITTENDGREPDTIRFADRLKVTGRFINQTSFSLTGGITTREVRVLDRATFKGGAEVKVEGVALSADSIIAEFSPSPTSKRPQHIANLNAVGHVTVKERNGSMTCRELDVEFAESATGRPQLRELTAKSDVHALQSSRTIRASEQLIVKFDQVKSESGPFNAAAAYAKAKKAGLDPLTIDWEAKRREHRSTSRMATEVSNIEAQGDVSVTDPDQSLNIVAKRLKCAVSSGDQIEMADVWGTEDEPAQVTLEQLTVIGKQIRMNVPEQWAQVPCAGRMSFLSDRDLDGRPLDISRPINISWRDKMSYVGKENKAWFDGDVHATSTADTSFDCQRLLVEFDDRSNEAPLQQRAVDWWILDGVMKQLTGDALSASQDSSRFARMSKEPAYLLATGRVVALTSEREEGRLTSRLRLAGPRLSLDLRAVASKLLIEGEGSLQMESFADGQASKTDADDNNGLFSLGGNDQSSKTLIEWEESMWYDFSVKQTQFHSNVSLRHFSGVELEKILGNTTSQGDGRRTFVGCQTLTANFDRDNRRDGAASGQRMGGLTAGRLSQFKATRDVTIQDKTEGLALRADRVEYLRDRDLLAIYGTINDRADLVIQREGQFPRKLAVERCFYNLKTGLVEISKTQFSGS